MADVWSSGPEMWAMFRRPRSTRCRTASRAPPRLSQSTNGTVGLVPGMRPTAVDHRDPRPVDDGGQGVVVVQRERQGAVDVPAPEIAGDPVVVPRTLHPQQHQLGVVRGQFPADAPYLLLEERVREDPELGLRDDHRHGAVAPGDQGAGRVIGHVTEFVDRPADLLDQRRPYARAPVDDPRGRGAGHLRRERRRLPAWGVAPWSARARRALLGCVGGAGVACGVRSRTDQDICSPHPLRALPEGSAATFPGQGAGHGRPAGRGPKTSRDPTGSEPRLRGRPLRTGRVTSADLQP